MQNQKNKSMVFVQWFAGAVLIITLIRTLLSPIIGLLHGLLSFILSSMKSSIGNLYDNLNFYIQAVVLENFPGFCLRSFFSVLWGLVGLLPFVLFVVYLFFLYQKNRHHVLLPVALSLSFLLGGANLMITGISIFQTFRHYLTWFGSFGVAVKQMLYSPNLIITFFITSLWLGICVLLVIDSFTKFRLRWVSCLWLVIHILIVLAKPMFTTLLAPVFSYILSEGWTTPLFELVKTIWDGFVMHPLQSMTLPTLLGHLGYLLITYIPTVFGLLTTFAYLLFWIFGAKRLPPVEAEEPVAEEIIEEAINVAAE